MYNMDHVNFAAGLYLLMVVCHRVAVIDHACGILIMATCVTFRINIKLLIRIFKNNLPVSPVQIQYIYTTIQLNINHFKLF